MKITINRQILAYALAPAAVTAVIVAGLFGFGILDTANYPVRDGDAARPAVAETAGRNAYSAEESAEPAGAGKIITESVFATSGAAMPAEPATGLPGPGIAPTGESAATASGEIWDSAHATPGGSAFSGSGGFARGTASAGSGGGAGGIGPLALAGGGFSAGGTGSANGGAGPAGGSGAGNSGTGGDETAATTGGTENTGSSTPPTSDGGSSGATGGTSPTTGSGSGGGGQNGGGGGQAGNNGPAGDAGSDTPPTTVVSDGERLGGTDPIPGDLDNKGTVNPGHSPGILPVAGDYIQASDGLLEIEITGFDPGTGYDQLDVAGSASLDGTLSILIDALFAPSLSVGDEFQIILADGGVSGEFSTILVNLPDFVFNVAYNNNDVTLRLIEIPELLLASFLDPLGGTGLRELPEPETLAVFVIGLAALFMLRRMRRRPAPVRVRARR